MPSLMDPPNPGIQPASLMSLALAGGFFTTSATWETVAREGEQWLLFTEGLLCVPFWAASLNMCPSPHHGTDR